MTYAAIKRFILWTPTITIGLWEYLRHTVLLPYLSMDLGNLLAPVLVFLVTVTLLRKLFAMLEHTQEELQREKMVKAAFQEREQLARELHDGIAQSLFLLSVKLDRLDRAESPEDVRETTSRIRRTVRRIHDDVRQSIAALRNPPAAADLPWMQSLRALAGELESSGGVDVTLDWRLPDGSLTRKEKVELLAILREAVMNIRKHARAHRVTIACVPDTEPADGGERSGMTTAAAADRSKRRSARHRTGRASSAGFRCTVRDDGLGADPQALEAKGKYGVRMMRDRAEAMGWFVEIRSCHGETEQGEGLPSGTVVEIVNKGEAGRWKMRSGRSGS